MTVKIPNSSQTYNIEGNADIDGTLNVDGASTLVGAVTLGKATASVGVQTSATALTATASGVEIPAGTGFVDVTVTDANHRVKLPTPVLGNIITLKANGTTNFELTTAANTQFINGTECTGTTSKELVCTAASTQVAVCTVGGATGKWIVYGWQADGTAEAGGTPD